jgi:hypothetical protein
LKEYFESYIQTGFVIATLVVAIDAEIDETFIEEFV